MGDGRVLAAYVYDSEFVTTSWHKSMMAWAFHFVQSDHFGAQIPIRYGTGGLVEARNKAVDVLLAQDDLDWLWWIDTDMGFHPDTVDRLMAAADPDERPVVGGLCFINHEIDEDGMGGYVTRSKPSLFNWAKNPDGSTGFVPDEEYKPDTLVRCAATGAACILIHRSVFEKIRDKNGGNYYGHIANPTTGGAFSEDFSFCLRCAEVEVPIYVHTGIQTTHRKPVWLSERHFNEQRC